MLRVVAFLVLALFLPLVFAILWVVGCIRPGTLGLLLDAVSVLLLTAYPHEPRMRNLEPTRVQFTGIILWWARVLFVVGIALMTWQNESCISN